eukprot:2865723-Pyramimonas_sp.AAC.1
MSHPQGREDIRASRVAAWARALHSSRGRREGAKITARRTSRARRSSWGAEREVRRPSFKR